MAAADGLGYRVRELFRPDETPEQYCAQLWRCDVPAADAIDAVTLPLFHPAEKHGGENDGWKCPVIEQAKQR